MSNTITGSCNCGDHTFTVPKPTEMNLCHCIDCCKWAGAFHSAHLILDTKSIDITSKSEIKTYRDKAESGKGMERAFCSNCGAGIWIRPAPQDGREPEQTNLKAGLFDRKEICFPTSENWLQNMLPWETPAKVGPGREKREAQKN